MIVSLTMRILQVITLCELGGAQSVVANLANGFSRMGHDVMVAAGEGDGKMWNLLDDNVQKRRVPSLKRAVSPVDEAKTIWKFHKLFKEFKPDVIHLHSSKAGVLGRLSFPKSKVVYTVHGFDSIRVAYRKFLPIEKMLKSRCKAIVGVSNYDCLNLKSENIFKNVACVYNGIESPAMLNENPFDQFKDYRGRVVTIARLSKPKRLDLFLKTASKLPDVAFIWIGNLTDPVGYIPSNVFFFGNRINAASYIKFADVFMLASDFEGLPMVIIESLATGTPVVASKVGGVPELLSEMGGYAVSNDADVFAEKINNILTDSSLASQMSDAARHSFVSHFTVERMLENYMTIYKS